MTMKKYIQMDCHKTVNVDSLSIFYREAGNPANSHLVLLHGLPFSSHQYRNLTSSLTNRFHTISPNYPGFGYSDIPDPCGVNLVTR